MPIYIFINPETNEQKEIAMSVSEMLEKSDDTDDSMVIDGVRHERCLACEHNGLDRVRHAAGWPMVSEAMGTHPDNVKTSIDHFQKMGVRVEYDKSGAMVFDNAAHRRKVLRAANYTDKQGYYDA